MSDRAPQQVFKTKEQPPTANRGDVWTDGKTFKRVYSRGGAWENVNLGSKHPDEDWPEQETSDEHQESGPETLGEPEQVSVGSGESAPGDGDDGKASGSAAGEPQTGPIEGEGVDGNGSPVLE